MTGISCQPCRNSSKLSWVQATLADLEQKMQMVAMNFPEEGDCDSFANRAENYYRQRPQLLNLLQDLYNRFVSLADRYTLVLKNQSHAIFITNSDIDEDSDLRMSNLRSADSDVESSLSYQLPSFHISTEADVLISEFVRQSIDNDMLVHELNCLCRCRSESTRKIDLQNSLLEVLESERLILLSENSRLGFQVEALTNDNKGLQSDIVLMQGKMNELTRCVMHMRDDHRVYLLSRKVEDLQDQVLGLQKRNKEYQELLFKREEKKTNMIEEEKFELGKLKFENVTLKQNLVKARNHKSKISKLWYQVKRADFLLCGTQSI